MIIIVSEILIMKVDGVFNVTETRRKTYYIVINYSHYEFVACFTYMSCAIHKNIDE